MVAKVVTFLIGEEILFFNCCNPADRRGNYKFESCDSDNNRVHFKSGVCQLPRDEQNRRSFQNGTSEVLGVPVRKGPSFRDETFEVLGSAVRKGRKAQDGTFEVLGAKPFEGLVAPVFRDETFESLG